MRIRQTIQILVATLLVAGCSSSQTEQSEVVGCDIGGPVDGTLQVATTVAPITSIVANIAGDTDTTIVGIVPEGTNSHTFEPKPSDAAVLESADVVFINGLVLEEPTKELALANLKEGASVCELGTEILPESDYIYDFSFPKDGGKPNPHLWTDPLLAVEYAAVIRDQFAALVPANAGYYADKIGRAHV